MAGGLQRLFTLAVALAFLAGSWVSLPSCAMAQPHPGLQVGMAGGVAQPPAASPGCAAHQGCLVAPAIPARPPSVAVAPRSIALRYDIAAPRLAGRSVEPDLFPPILAS